MDNITITMDRLVADEAQLALVTEGHRHWQARRIFTAKDCFAAALVFAVATNSDSYRVIKDAVDELTGDCAAHLNATDAAA